MSEGGPVDTLTAAVDGAKTANFSGIEVAMASFGDARIKRLIYAVGGRWSTHVKPNVDTEWCEHAHVGYLARGRFVGEYADGSTFDYTAPAFIAVDPGHDSWVEGDTEVVLIQFDFEGDTVERLGLHSHSAGDAS
ncbi:MAG: hypothetical protein ACK5RL_05000 [Acidimicrobiales bacterium]